MKTDPHTAPTWENQLYRARQLADEKGLAALWNPHAMTGRICGCGSCFCCAALFVYLERHPATAKPATLGASNAPATSADP